MKDLTPKSKALFQAICADTFDREGHAWWGVNVGATRASSPVLGGLVKRGYVTSTIIKGKRYIDLTATGADYAQVQGFKHYTLGSVWQPAVTPQSKATPLAKKLTPKQEDLFLAICEDSGNWSGSLCWGANIGGDLSSNAVLGSLIKRGYVDSMEDEGQHWVTITEEGSTYAKSQGYKHETVQNGYWSPKQVNTNPTQQPPVGTTRANMVHAAVKLAVDKAIELGLADSKFHCTTTIRAKAGCSGGVDRTGRCILNMSTHDRYHDIGKHMRELASRSGSIKKHYEVAVRNWRATGIPHLCEYPSINKDSEIGELVTSSSWLQLLSVTCHEVAHSLTYYQWLDGGSMANAQRSSRPKPHGTEWRANYRALRNELVNKFVSMYQTPDTSVVDGTPVKVTPPQQVTVVVVQGGAKKPVKRTKRAKKVVVPPADGFTHTRETSVMHAIITMLLTKLGATQEQIANHCGIPKGNVSAAVTSHIPKKGYIVETLETGALKITNSKKVW